MSTNWTGEDQPLARVDDMPYDAEAADIEAEAQYWRDYKGKKDGCFRLVVLLLVLLPTVAGAVWL